MVISLYYACYISIYYVFLIKLICNTMIIPYEINQKELSVKQAYLNLMKQLNEFIEIRAKQGLPFSSLVGFKRELYRYKKVVVKDNITEKPKDTPEINNDLGLLVEDVFNKMGVDVLEAVKADLIGRKELVRALIKHDYAQMAKQGKKYKDIKAELSEKYEVSVSSIEKLVYRKSG